VVNDFVILSETKNLIPLPVIASEAWQSQYLGVPLRVGLYATSPRFAAGFSLQSLTQKQNTEL